LKAGFIAILVIIILLISIIVYLMVRYRFIRIEIEEIYNENISLIKTYIEPILRYPNYLPHLKKLQIKALFVKQKSKIKSYLFIWQKFNVPFHINTNGKKITVRSGVLNLKVQPP